MFTRVSSIFRGFVGLTYTSQIPRTFDYVNLLGLLKAGVGDLGEGLGFRLWGCSFWEFRPNLKPETSRFGCRSGL